MKNAVFILLVILTAGCLPSNQIYEDQLYVTRKYVGNFDTTVVVQERQLFFCHDITIIYTDRAHFRIWGNPGLDIPPSARCYLRYIAEVLPGPRKKVWVLYFTWDGTENLYMLQQDYYTGKVY